MKSNEIKALTPTKCPHCLEPIVIELTSDAPKLTDILTPTMIEEAKDEALRRILSLGLPDESTRDVVSWVKDQNTIFGKNDIEEIIKNITSK